MTSLLSNARATVLLYKMQIAWFALFTFSALGSAVMTALAGTNWSGADDQTRFMICVGVFVSWANTMMALFNKSMARLRDGELPFADQETTVKTTIQQETKISP